MARIPETELEHLLNFMLSFDYAGSPAQPAG